MRAFDPFWVSRPLRESPHSSPGNHILSDYYSNVMWGDVVVTSNVPVTIQRYSDGNANFASGEQPLKQIELKVLVTSNCSSDASSIIPSVTVDLKEGDIDIQVDGVLPETPPYPFLASSSYHASYSYTTDCYIPTPPPAPEDEGITEEETVREETEGTTTTRDASSAFVVRRSFPFSALAMLQNFVSAIPNRRKLEESETCIFNAKILLDGCERAANITAPSARVINSAIANLTGKQIPNTCTTEYEADLTFDTEPVLEANDTLHVPKMKDDPLNWDLCPARPVDGRPFVDSTGHHLLASPLILTSGAPKDYATTDFWWSTDDVSTPRENSTTDAALLLGEEWTKSALGEHASVASFAAFSIALMTNGAPSNLIEDALHAALDEVRHARASFSIASKLTGLVVEPGQLPESKHFFGQDLKALAMAVAKEGCIDEALSALEAAAKVEQISVYLETTAEGTKSIQVLTKKYLLGFKTSCTQLQWKKAATLLWRGVH